MPPSIDPGVGKSRVAPLLQGSSSVVNLGSRDSSPTAHSKVASSNSQTRGNSVTTSFNNFPLRNSFPSKKTLKGSESEATMKRLEQKSTKNIRVNDIPLEIDESSYIRENAKSGQSKGKMLQAKKVKVSIGPENFKAEINARLQ